MSTDAFDVKLTFKGRHATLSNISSATTIGEIHRKALDELGLSGDDVTLKLLHKGKVLDCRTSPDAAAFPGVSVVGGRGKPVKVVAMAADRRDVSELNSGRSDPLMRGFDGEKGGPRTAAPSYWGPDPPGQHRHFKFVRFEACTRQSFGHRAGSRTPHAFRAAELLERLATDPGIVAVMTERELVVNALGEMDPIDDRLMQKKKTEEGLCLLGYNTNRGLRIDVKLRTDDLSGFLPYEDLAATLLHELSHNWVGEHDALFWTNYGQMRVEYLHRHASLAASGYYVGGRTTAALAGVAEQCKDGMSSISKSVLEEIAGEAGRHGIPVDMIAPAILQRCRELTVESMGSESGQKLGGDSGISQEDTGNNTRSARELALAAAERRAREDQEGKGKGNQGDGL